MYGHPYIHTPICHPYAHTCTCMSICSYAHTSICSYAQIYIHSYTHGGRTKRERLETHRILAQDPSESRTSMLGRYLQSAPGRTGMFRMRAATSGFISLQMWSVRIGCSCCPRTYSTCTGTHNMTVPTDNQIHTTCGNTDNQITRYIRHVATDNQLHSQVSGSEIEALPSSQSGVPRLRS